MKHYEQALEIDPDLADAWVGMVGSKLIQVIEQETDPEVFMTSSKALLEKALEIDPNHAEAHIRLARYYRVLSDVDAA
jgi:cytochrome c-type biogenesis protein CcmH/NrfG